MDANDLRPDNNSEENFNGGSVNPFQAFIISLTNLNGYGPFARQSFGRTFVYLLMLIVLAWAVNSYVVKKRMYEFEKIVLGHINGRIPNMVVENGELDIDVAEPYVIFEVEEDNQLYIALIDTTGGFSSLDDYDAGFLLTKKSLIIKGPRQTEEIPLTQIMKYFNTRYESIGQSKVEDWLHYFVEFMIKILSYFILPVWELIAKPLTALLLSMAAVITSSSNKKGYSFGSLYQVSIYAMTSVVVVDAIGSIMGYPLWIVGFIIGIFVTIKAVKALPPVAKGEVT